MRKTNFTMTFLLAAMAVIFWYSSPPVMARAETDSCFSCHNSPKKLIEITRKLYENKVKAESKSSGPG